MALAAGSELSIQLSAFSIQEKRDDTRNGSSCRQGYCSRNHLFFRPQLIAEG